MLSAVWRSIVQNPVFRFLSSVRLAVPLLIVLSLILAAGTLIESRYNTRLAQLWVYETPGFYAVLLLLGINILFAALIRIPWKKHQTGFVITHAGLLLLLFGAAVTLRYGIDGQLIVEQGSQSQTVILPYLQIDAQVSGKSHIRVPLQRGLDPLNESSLHSLNQSFVGLFKLTRYLPYTQLRSEYTAGPAQSGLAVQLELKSRFFQVSEWLHETQDPYRDLGPASLQLIAHPQNDSSVAPSLDIYFTKSGKITQSIPLSKLAHSGARIGDIKIHLVRALEQAVVTKNKITDEGKKGLNPALELMIETPKGKIREIAFALFPDFSLHSDTPLPFQIRYHYPAHSAHSSGSGKQIDVVLLKADPPQFEIAFKQGEQVLLKAPLTQDTVAVGPWMEIQIKLLKVLPSAIWNEQVEAAPLKERADLPPSGFELRLPDSQTYWIREGQEQTLSSQGREIQVYYGPQTLRLPFSIHLDRFTKKDYLRTSTPMEFESDVTVSSTGQKAKISMNEPLKISGFTLYQSSYEIRPDGRTFSIFSVNQDPGRAIKYLGGLVLALGIILFTLMRSRAYRKKSATAYSVGLVAFLLMGTSSFADTDPNPAELFKKTASTIPISASESIPVLHNGRIKPLHTLARETLLLISGKYTVEGVPSVAAYLALAATPAASRLQILEVRSPELRLELNLDPKRTRFSLEELENTDLATQVRPLLNRSMSAGDKTKIDTFHQIMLLKEVISGEHWNQNKMQVSEFPEEIRYQLKNIPIELTLNHLRPFFWAAVGYCLLGLVLLMAKLHKKWITALFAIPVILHISGFTMRILITGFAPVTNMYGTMIWVALGVAFFNFGLLLLYGTTLLSSMVWIGCSLILFLAESIPLTLSPDLDPIVAVLRSNYWLTIHVLTITLSYAALTIAMLIGNTALVRTLISPQKTQFYRNYAHLCYRMIQLGVFLLSVGIILGGIWADYSWGRFWGWDPKETWALIVDLGFIAILHARLIGWAGPLGTLIAAPIAYLLVLMAWYGVNFILAAGLHSYGFSSGGATMVVTFVALQIFLLMAVFFRSRC